MNGYTGTFEMVDPRTIVVDHRYQRAEKENLIAKIAQDPTWEAFGVPVCFKRESGMLYCADGQQRIRGLLQSDNPPRLIPVVWFPLHGVADEAEVFVRINEWRKQLDPMEKYKGRLVAKDPAALAIERAVEHVGFSVGYAASRGSDARTIQAIGSLGVIYDQIGEEGVVQTLTVIREAWPDEGEALGVHILRGVANLIEEYGEKYNRAEIVAGLRKSSPGKILRKAEELRFDNGNSKLYNVRRAIKALCKV